MVAPLFKRELALLGRPGKTAVLVALPVALALGRAAGLPPGPDDLAMILAATASLGAISSLEADRGNRLLWMLLNRRGTLMVIALKAAFALTSPLIFLLTLSILPAASRQEQVLRLALPCLAATAVAVPAGVFVYGLLAEPLTALWAAWAAAVLLAVPARSLLEGSGSRMIIWLSVSGAIGLIFLSSAMGLHRRMKVDDEDD
jgi:hypothetical protein